MNMMFEHGRKSNILFWNFWCEKYFWLSNSLSQCLPMPVTQVDTEKVNSLQFIKYNQKAFKLFIPNSTSCKDTNHVNKLINVQPIPFMS